MIKNSPFKFLGVLALTIGFGVGCATQPKQAPEPTPEDDEMEEPAPEPTQPAGPTEADVQAALDSARAAVEDAKSRKWIWKSTESILKQAEKAAEKGEREKAIKLANEAESQAHLATNQYYLEHGKLFVKDIDDYYADSLTPAQERRLKQIKQLIRQGKGRAVYDRAKALLAEVEAAGVASYTVERGDHLWGIASMRRVYGNPYKWPLIYKENADKIDDPDLIYPGQTFDIDQRPSSAEANRAIEHAKTRGAWSLGVTEESDQRYLAGE